MNNDANDPNIKVFKNTVAPSPYVKPTGPETGSPAVPTYSEVAAELWNTIRARLAETITETAVRNQMIQERDEYVYGDRLKHALDIPVGHDFTPVNWLKRTVEIHKQQFMGRPFQIISTYNSKDLDTAQDDKDKQRLQIENKKQKTSAELREDTIRAIIRDNGGHSLFMEGAESGSVAGSFIIKAWYDEDNSKYTLSPVEAIENCYVVWSADDFRKPELFGYVYQITKHQAIDQYNVPESVPTSPVGAPLGPIGQTTPQSQLTSEKMVTVIEATGTVPGWKSVKGRVQKCAPGAETQFNATYVGNKLVKLIDIPKRVPKYYIFPNKKERRRAWGVSDITDAAIHLNLTYIETLSDWRTIAAKVNFPKFKAFGFGPSAQLPKFKSRQIQAVPLTEGQDLAQLGMGDPGSVDFRAQLQEIKEQFVRETGVAQVLLDNAGMDLNSNQALITSMKPTSDIAENKKELWTPILIQMFQDAIETLADYDKATYGDLADETDPWMLRVQWPSQIQKEDPIYQQMLLNRWNSRTMSLQSFLEAQGESAEEIERIRDEMADITTAAIHAGQSATLFSLNFMPPPTSAPPRVTYNLRGELDPYQVGNITYEHGGNKGQTTPNDPYPTSAGPQGYAGVQADANAINTGFLQGQYPNQQPVQQGPDGKPIATAANNQPGSQPVSQPGSGATPVSPQGALNQTQQNAGQ